MSWVNVLDGPFLREWEQRQRAPVSAIPTRLPSLNRVCGDDGGRLGLAHGWFVSLGGNPGHGKSLTALNFAFDALCAGQSVGFVSLEMSDYALATRLYAIATGTPVRQLERGPGFNPGDIQTRMRDIWAENHCADLHVNREPIQSIQEVQSYLESAATVGTKVFFCDYVQLIGTGDDESVYKQTAEVATVLRRFAHERKALVIALSQYNRRTSADYTQSPIAQSLHGGMSLEANSDLVILLDHSRYERDAAHNHIARTFLLAVKNRHGGTGEVPIEWNYETLRLREADPDEEQTWPDRKKGAR